MTEKISMERNRHTDIYILSTASITIIFLLVVISGSLFGQVNKPEEKVFQDRVSIATFWMPEEPKKWSDIIIYPDRYPEPEYGWDSLKVFFRSNIKRVDGILNRSVFVEFIVNENGSLSDLILLKGINEEADAEAIRVLKLASNWKPARRFGFPIKYKIIIPVKYE